MCKSGRSVVIACEYAARERVECNLFDRNRKKPTIMPSCSRRVNRKEDLFLYHKRADNIKPINTKFKMMFF